MRIKLSNTLIVIGIYTTVIVSVFVAVAYINKAGRAQTATPNGQVTPLAPPVIKPKFSVSTTRSYYSDEKTRVYVNYQGIKTLDFRIYQVKDQFKFFRQLNDPHVMQGDEEEKKGRLTAAASIDDKPTLLEKAYATRRSILSSIKGYFRGQVRRESRTAFNDKYRTGEQVALNTIDYAKVPILNHSQLRKTFRQVLPPLDYEHDTRMVPLGNMEPGVYLVEAINENIKAYTIVVVTDMMLIRKTTTDGDMVVYVVDSKSGSPRGNTDVEVLRKGKSLAQGATDGNGILRTTVKADPPPKKENNQDVDPETVDTDSTDYLILAKNKNDFTVSDMSSWTFKWNHYSGGGGDEFEGDYEGGYNSDYKSYIYTERPVYRPNQTTYFKGILRKKLADDYQLPAFKSVTITIKTPDGNEASKTTVPLSARGTFNGSFNIADGAPLGYYNIAVANGEASVASGGFEVEEYKKPEYKVKVTTPKKFVPAGDKTSFTVEAKYFFGEPVANAEVKYYIYRVRYYPWWRSNDDDDGLGESAEAEDDSGEGGGYSDKMMKEGEGVLDEKGNLKVEFEVPKPDSEDRWDYSYRLDAEVTDSARRVINGNALFTGTRGDTMADASTDKYVYYQGDSARINVNTTDYDGRPRASKVTLRFIDVKYDEKEVTTEYGYKYKSWTPRYTTLSTASLSTNSQGSGSYQYKVPQTGYIRIETVLDYKGSEVVSYGGGVYAVDRNNNWPDYASMDRDSIKLVPDKKTYKPGDVARVLAVLPEGKTHLLVTTERNAFKDVRYVYAQGRSTVIDVPIKDNYTPNIYLSICYAKNGEMHTQSENLNVPARNKFLQIDILPDKKEYKPRDPASYTVIAKNADGTPAADVELSMGVVDEAIYSIRGDSSGDIRRAFYSKEYNSVSTDFSNAWSFTGYSGKKSIMLTRNKRSHQLADFKNEDQFAKATIRKLFKDTAFWQPEAITGADGKAVLKFDLPDNLTTWRATVRAVSADLKVGSRIDKVISRKDLILRLETPRFITEGDDVTISGIVHNYLEKDMVTKISLQVTGANTPSGAVQTVTIPKRKDHRIDWRISTSLIGNVTLLAKAETSQESDGMELPLPVIPAGLKQNMGGAVALSDEAAEKGFSLNVPADANAQARSLRIEASPSIAGSLFGALDYLTSYPYGCTEQTMSSFLPNVVVAQVLKDVDTTSLRSTNDLAGKVQRGLDRLYGFQHTDGGWGWWKDDKTDPFMTAYVIDGLSMARRAGYSVNEWTINNGRNKVKQLLDANKMEDGKPIDLESRAYLVYSYYASSKSTKDDEPKYLEDLFSKKNDLQPYGRALLALSLKSRGDTGRGKQIVDEISRTAKLNDFDAHWESVRRPMLDFMERADLEATALSLKAIAQLNPKSDLLPKAARWLVGNRSNGYFWSSTKQTAFAVYGLIDYIRVAKELNADYYVEVYLNGEQILNEHVTAANAIKGKPFVIERKGGALAANNQIRIVKRGAGVLYASAVLGYFTRGDKVAEKSTPNLKLTRDYMRLKVENEKWVVEPLTGEVKSGDLIVSRLRITGSRGRYMMVEDPIPAGCEQIDRLEGVVFNSSNNSWTDWYSNREFRDQRTVIFADYFDGDVVYQYAMRVQIPGEFKVAPARAELMYEPTVQSNTGTYRMKIIDKK